jgi:hypothetical protein
MTSRAMELSRPLVGSVWGGRRGRRGGGGEELKNVCGKQNQHRWSLIQIASTLLSLIIKINKYGPSKNISEGSETISTAIESRFICPPLMPCQSVSE